MYTSYSTDTFFIIIQCISMYMGTKIIIMVNKKCHMNVINLKHQEITVKTVDGVKVEEYVKFLEVYVTVLCSSLYNIIIIV